MKFSSKMELIPILVALIIIGGGIVMFAKIEDSTNKLVLIILGSSTLVAEAIRLATEGRGLISIQKSVLDPVRIVCFLIIFYVGTGILSGQGDVSSDKILLSILVGCMIIADEIKLSPEKKKLRKKSLTRQLPMVSGMNKA